MPRKKTVDSLIKSPGSIRGVLKRKKIYEMKDPEGREIPIDALRDHYLTKDYFVRNIGEMWLEIWEKLRHLKKLLLEGGPKMYEYLERHDDVRSDSKGGFTEYTFDKSMKVIVSYNLRYDIDESLMERSAKHMDLYLEKKGEPALVKIIRTAFKQRNGQYDIRALNRLDTIKEDDEDFRKALELKNEAISSTPTKLRTQFAVRNKEGEFIKIPLAITDVAIEGEEKLRNSDIKRALDLKQQTS